MSEKRFGTFEGVFTPSILTIIGVIMYLRLGWVVGTVGLGGGINYYFVISRGYHHYRFIFIFDGH